MQKKIPVCFALLLIMRMGKPSVLHHMTLFIHLYCCSFIIILNIHLLSHKCSVCYTSLVYGEIDGRLVQKMSISISLVPVLYLCVCFFSGGGVLQAIFNSKEK